MSIPTEQRGSLNAHQDQGRLRPAITQGNEEQSSLGPLKQSIKRVKKTGRPATKFCKVSEVKKDQQMQGGAENNKESEIKQGIQIQEVTTDEGNIIAFFSMSEGKNEVKIILRKQSNRMVKMEFLFNNINIKPGTFNGISSAMNFWNLFKSMVK